MIITERSHRGVQSVRRFNYGAFSFYLLHFKQSYILINHILCVRYSTAYSICWLSLRLGILQYWLITSYLRVEYSTQLFLKAFTVSIVLAYILVLVVFYNILPIGYLQYYWEHIAGILVPGTNIGYMQVMLMVIISMMDVIRMTIYLQVRCLNGTYGYDGYASTYMPITMVSIYLLMCLQYLLFIYSIVMVTMQLLICLQYLQLLCLWWTQLWWLQLW